jgi:uncharacterized protein YbbK (DUF523 family)
MIDRRESLLVSACLLGEACKYNGGDNRLPDETLAALEVRYRLVAVCPERDGGLPTPRLPSERRGSGVFNRAGEDVTAQFRRGAELALETAKAEGCRIALLKECSPSCGAGRIYDGSFTGTLIPGNGLTAELLQKSGLAVLGETEAEKLL